MIPESFICSLSSSSRAALVGGPECDGRRLYVELLSQVFEALLPSSLVEDAEDAARPAAVLQSPRTQGSEQGL